MRKRSWVPIGIVAAAWLVLGLPGHATAREETGELADGDATLNDGKFVDKYALQATAGESFVIDLSSEDFDTYLIVTGVEDSEFAQENDDFEGSMSRSRIRMTARVAGTYVVHVTSYSAGETGTYRLTIGEALPSSSESIRQEGGELAEGDATLSKGEFVDKYSLNTTAGESFIIDLSSEEFDTYLMVTGVQDSGFVQENDDFENSSNRSQIRMTARVTGTYVVHVTSYSAGETGAYRLTISSTPSGPGASPPGELVASDTCILRITTVAGATVFVDGRDHGDERELTFNDLDPGRQYVSQVRFRFPGGGEAQRVAIVQGGRVVHVAALAPTRIVFAFDRRGDSPSQIYSVNPDGSDFRRVVRSNVTDFSPALSPDGSQIAFVRRQESTGDLYVVSADGGQVQRIASDVSEDAPVWSPDSTRIAFTSGDEIRIADVNGSGARYVADGVAPTWSPDGRRIAFHAGTSDDSDWRVQIADENGANLRELTSGFDPLWSPDGSQLTFLREGEWDNDLYIIGVDGAAQSRLADEVFWEYNAWSPDSRRIAYISGDGDIHVVNRDGSGDRAVFVSGEQRGQSEASLWVGNEAILWGDEWFPLPMNWSPDGSQIAFWCTPADESNAYIYVVNADGTGLKPLVRYQGWAFDPSWR